MNETRIEHLLRLGDAALILSQRLSEWCGKGPALGYCPGWWPGRISAALTNMGSAYSALPRRVISCT